VVKHQQLECDRIFANFTIRPARLPTEVTGFPLLENLVVKGVTAPCGWGSLSFDGLPFFPFKFRRGASFFFGGELAAGLSNFFPGSLRHQLVTFVLVQRRIVMQSAQGQLVTELMKQQNFCVFGCINSKKEIFCCWFGGNQIQVEVICCDQCDCESVIHSCMSVLPSYVEDITLFDEVVDRIDSTIRCKILLSFVIHFDDAVLLRVTHPTCFRSCEHTVLIQCINCADVCSSSTLEATEYSTV
jgi:hypothetical protein